MTEEEWAQADNPYVLLQHPGRPLNRRLTRLYLGAHCRLLWERLPGLARVAVEAMEDWADGKGYARLADVKRRLWVYAHPPLRLALQTEDASRQAVRAVLEAMGDQWGLLHLAGVTNDRARSAIIRDVFGNPFRPVACEAAWRTDTAVTLAKQMYESRDFGAMPILADALQDAGCDDADILDHCRSGGPHVRGCWVVDLVLGKS